MIITLSNANVAWRQADDVVHVATVTNEYAGFIERTPEGFYAHGSCGENLGLHPSSELARAVVAAFVASPSEAHVPSHPHSPPRARRRGHLVASWTQQRTRRPLAT